jgi:hypothetical protein
MGLTHGDLRERLKWSRPFHRDLDHPFNEGCTKIDHAGKQGGEWVMEKQES